VQLGQGGSLGHLESADRRCSSRKEGCAGSLPVIP